ncbi:MAG TPA: hypothetical protein VF572_00740 [Candidatus Saccharimonadales bacterium]|jgi:hypothetical protein
MSYEIPTSAPYENKFADGQVSPYTVGQAAISELTAETAPLGLTAEGRPITRVAGDFEFVRIMQSQRLTLEDIAAGAYPRKYPNPFLHPIEAMKTNEYNIQVGDYTAKSQIRENLSPDKAHAMAKAESIDYGANVAETQAHREANAEVAAAVGIAVMGAPGLGSLFEDTSTPGSDAAIKAGIEFDKEQAKRLLEESA